MKEPKLGDMFNGKGEHIGNVHEQRKAPSTGFYRADGRSGGNHRCERCGAAWTDHYAPNSRCARPVPSAYRRRMDFRNTDAYWRAFLGQLAAGCTNREAEQRADLECFMRECSSNKT